MCIRWAESLPTSKQRAPSVCAKVCPLINRPPIPSGVFGMWFLGMALGDAIYTFLLDASEKYRSRTDSSGSVDKKGA